ncbi:MAG: leucine-rich repeat protein [Clostridia bacterium]|nr:leucine-rich repeat protein [Clostridia bacterium]
MKSKLLTILTSIMLLCLCLFTLTACEEDSSDGSTSDSIDYSKYDYYGNYTLDMQLTMGEIDLELRLNKTGTYNLVMSGHQNYNVFNVTEIGNYSMEKFAKPRKTETMQAIYELKLTPIKSTGFYESIINLNNIGYVSQVQCANLLWIYYDFYNETPTLFLQKETGEGHKFSFAPLSYAIEYYAEEGGTIEGNTLQSVKENENGTEVTAVPNYGYAFASWSDGVTTATRKESNVNSDIEVTANFVEALPKYTLTYTCTYGGTLQGELSQTLFQGLDGTKVTAVPNKRLHSEDYPYQFIEWSDGVKTAERTDLNVQDNMSVTAIFKPQFRYYAENCNGGRIEISTDTANYANNYTVTATAIADEGWVFVEWKDGVKTETRTDVLTRDTSVQAVFAREINVIATTGGKIINREEVTAERQITLHIKPPTNLETIYYIQAIADEGYKFVGWSSSENGSYIVNINETEMIDFYFDYNTYYAIFAVNGEQGGQSGGISGDNNQEDGNSGATEDDNQDNATQDYELEYVYSEKLQGYSVAGINMNSESETLYDVTIPSTYRSVAVKGIDDNAFAYCRALKSVTIENGITIIGSSAFYSCDSLTSVTIGNGVTSIGSYAFEYCDSLTSIVIPDSVTSIGNRAFYNCDSLKYNVKDNLRYLGNSENPYLYLAGTTSNSITTATIDNNCKFIGSSAFYNCDSLTSIVIPDSVTSIGDWAFADCTSLTSIVIPDSVTSIGYCAFDDCDSLTKVNYLGTIDSWVQIEFDDASSNPIYYADNLYINDLLVAEAILTSATKISSYAFYNCDSLTSIVIPDSVTSIGDWAFADCTSLTSIVIPDSVTSIGSFAFDWCTSLMSVTIGNGVTNIGYEAFYYCRKLISIVIPDSVTSIGYGAFCYCDSLTSIIIPDSVTSIGGSAFAYCDSLTSIVIPDSVTSIGDSAFEYCYKLVEVINNSSNITVEKGSEDNGYLGYYALSVFNSGDTYVNRFSTNSNGYVIYTEGEDKILVKYVGEQTELTLPNDITKIHQSAFYNNNKLTSIVIPDSVTSIGDSAFYDCDSLTSIKYRGSQSQWSAISKASDWNSYTGNYTITYNYTGD